MGKKKFRRKHIVKIALISLYALMVASMLIGWSLKGI